MAIWEMLASQVAAPIAQAGSSYISELTGQNKRNADRQIKQQEKLTNIQQKATWENMDKSQEQNKEMFDYTFGIQSNYDSAKEQVERYKEAGLNPALMYSQGNAGFAGGTTGNQSGGNVTGGTASDEASRKQNDIAEQGMALQLAKLSSEIDVNRSVAERNRADAQTTNDSRSILIENMRQSGEKQWLENVIKKYEMQFDASDKNSSIQAWNKEFGDIWISADSAKKQELANAILKTAKEIESLGKQADAAMLNAETNKLEMEFGTGKEINWKNVGDIVSKLLPMVIRGRK